MEKILAESLSEYKQMYEESEVIKGEQPVGIKAEDVDPKEFLVGIAVEKEHSKNLAVQKTIALQHLAENPKYYSEGMKKGIFDEPDAINIYKKYFIDKEKPEDIQNESLTEGVLNEGHANTGWTLGAKDGQSAVKEVLQMAKDHRDYGDGDLRSCYKAIFIGETDWERADARAERNEGTAMVFKDKESGKYAFAFWFRT